MTLVIMLGSGVIAPVLPLLAQEFGVSYAGAGALVSAFALGRIPFDFIGGTLVDRTSPRLVASGGAALVTLSALLSTQVESFGFLLVYRLIGGIGSALFIITAMAFLVRTVAPKHMGQAMGFYQSMLLLGVSFGPSVGGVAASFFDSLYAPFWAMTVLSFAVTIMCLRWIREFPRSASDTPVAPTQPVSMYQVLRQLIWDPTFLFACLLTFLTFAVRSGMMMTLVPLFAQETAQVTETGIGSLQSASSFANLLILWHAGRLLDHVGRRRVAIPFCVCHGFDHRCLSMGNNVWALIAGQCRIWFSQRIFRASSGCHRRRYCPEGGSWCSHGTVPHVWRFWAVARSDYYRLGGRSDWRRSNVCRDGLLYFARCRIWAQCQGDLT